MRILIASGANLDLLGRREPEIYGHDTLLTMESRLREWQVHLSQRWQIELALTFYQTNDEAKLLARIDSEWDGIVINAGGWTHTSVVLADRLVGLGVPYIEVHVSQTARRERFRHHSYLAAHAIGVISGLGIDSYAMGLIAMIEHLRSR